MIVIKRYNDGTTIDFDTGRIDQWGVHVSRPGIIRYRPTDKEYFTQMAQMSLIHGVERVYSEIVRIYDITSKELDNSVLELIDNISRDYGKDTEAVNILYTVLYAAMIAEENRMGTRLGKRIKRLGIHQVLMDGMEISKATEFSKGMPWRDINRECEARGF